MSAPRNQLANETSLYLRQHAGNPVDWHPWGQAALARARDLDRPIFLSIGYSACHWCHVMEHESFEDEATARLLNEHFVSIKVDREERPDLDDIYMKAVQLLNQGQGGWPMSVWLTPELRPFFAGTYFPPDDRYGRPSFRRVLAAIATAWRERRDELTRTAGEIVDHLRGLTQLPEAETVDPTTLLRNAGRALARNFDATHGGFGGAPKFPHAIELRLLLRLWLRFRDGEALSMVRTTLDRMAGGGMYDQLRGGFHRYSTDARWLVPHFEKMLYDNALLAVAYLEAFQATADPYYRRIVEETLDYVIGEMTSAAGGFYSTQDADSEGEEGKFFVWTKAEFDAVVGPADAELAGSAWGVTADGNFEGHNILHRIRTDEQDARLLGIDVNEFRRRLAVARQKLLDVRSRRVWPGRDEKILTSWNGLMIAAFARAGAVLDRPDYVRTAERAAHFVFERLRTADGRLLRTCAADGPGKLAGYLEDYAHLAEALTHLFEATFEGHWVIAAGQLADAMLTQFADPAGGFFTTATDHDELIMRPKELHDGSTPSGNAMAVTALLRLARLLGRDDYRAAAANTLRAFGGLIANHPSAAGQMLIALDFELGPVQEAVVVGDETASEYRRVVQVARAAFAPRRLVIGGQADLPLLQDRPSSGPVTLYVCENESCRAPVSDPVVAEQILREEAGAGS